MLEGLAQKRLVEADRAFLDVACDIFRVAFAGEVLVQKLVLGKHDEHHAHGHACHHHGHGRPSVFVASGHILYSPPALLTSRLNDKRSISYFCLNTLPSFMTKLTFSSVSMCASGSPFTAITSAKAPGAITPSSPFLSSNSAARDVPDLMASMGAMPNLTM